MKIAKLLNQLWKQKDEMKMKTNMTLRMMIYPSNTNHRMKY